MAHIVGRGRRWVAGCVIALTGVLLWSAESRAQSPPTCELAGTITGTISGQLVTFQAVITNVGTGTCNYNLVSPAQPTFGSFTGQVGGLETVPAPSGTNPSGAGRCLFNAPTLLCPDPDLAVLRPGGSTTITITATAVDDPPACAYSLTGVLTGMYDTNSNQRVSDLIFSGLAHGVACTQPPPQFALNKTAPSAVTVGEVLPYTITLTNNGNGFSGNTLVVEDALPAGVSYIDVAPGTNVTSVACIPSSPLVCTVSLMRQTLGTPTTFTITTTAPATSQRITNYASTNTNGDGLAPSLPPSAANCTLAAQAISGTVCATATTQISGPVLDIDKRASVPSFVVGQPASYTITVTNRGSAATPIPATVQDALPANLALGSLPTGCTASAAVATCTIPAGLASGASISFSLPVTPLAAAAGTTLTNVATVAGGGDAACSIACASPPVLTPVNAPKLSIVKSASAASFVVGQPASYTLTVTNGGNAATTAIATVTDRLPDDLDLGTTPPACDLAVQILACTIPAGLAPGNSVSFTIPVTPSAAAASATLTNVARIAGGGDPACAIACDSNPVTTPVRAPQLSITKSASAAAFVVGQPATYTITVTNTGTASTTATATVSDRIPVNLIVGSLPTDCNAKLQLITCTLAAGLTTNAHVSFVVPVTPTAAASGATLMNTANVVGGGDPHCATGCTSPPVVTPVNAPKLAIAKTASAPSFVVGQAASYTLTVSNAGTVATTGAVTVTDNVPANLTIGAVSPGCTVSGHVVVCTIASGLVPNAPVNFTVAVTPTAAAAGTSLVNTATVTGGGDPTCASGCASPPVTTPVNAPKLSITKSLNAASFVVGQVTSYVITVTNVGTVATTADAIVSDRVPTNLIVGAVPSDCTAKLQLVTCTIRVGLATHTPVAFTIPVTAIAAAAGSSVTNTATVAGGGDPTCVTACASLPVTTPVNAPKLTITKAASAASFVVGQVASYTITVTNAGTIATTAAATISDPVPGNLSIGITPAACSVIGQTVTCMIPPGLAVNSPLRITIPVTPTAAAAGTALTNVATITGGGDPSCATICRAPPVTTPVNSPKLQITKSASATSFVVGQPASYTLSVANIGSVATTSMATVRDALPSNLTIDAVPTACTVTGHVVKCDVASGLPVGAPIGFVIAVTPTTAAAGTTLTNTATITGGGDPTCTSACLSNTVVVTVPAATTPTIDVMAQGAGTQQVPLGAAVTVTTHCINDAATAADAVSCVVSGMPAGGSTTCSPLSPVASFAAHAQITCVSEFEANQAGTVVLTTTASTASVDSDLTNDVALSTVVVTSISTGPPDVATPVPALNAAGLVLLLSGICLAGVLRRRGVDHS